MPMVWDGAQLRLHCINHSAHNKPGPTMTKVSGWAALVKASPDAIDPGESLPVSVFVCSICGYLELYAATKTDPETWGEGHV